MTSAPGARCSVHAATRPARVALKHRVLGRAPPSGAGRSGPSPRPTCSRCPRRPPPGRPPGRKPSSAGGPSNVKLGICNPNVATTGQALPAVAPRAAGHRPGGMPAGVGRVGERVHVEEAVDHAVVAAGSTVTPASASAAAYASPSSRSGSNSAVTTSAGGRPARSARQRGDPRVVERRAARRGSGRRTTPSSRVEEVALAVLDARRLVADGRGGVDEQLERASRPRQLRQRHDGGEVAAGAVAAHGDAGGSPPSSAACSAAQRTAATASSTAAGKGCSGASR